MQLVRETLDEGLAPAVATTVLFEALDRWGPGLPESQEEVRALVRGPLTAVLTERCRPRLRDQLVRSIERRLAKEAAAMPSLEIEIADLDTDSGPLPRYDDDSMTVQMPAVAMAVTVLVAAASETFGERLVASLGDDRVRPLTFRDPTSIRHAMFSRNPLLLVVDGTSPPPIGPSVLAQLLHDLPDRTLPVVWAVESAYGHALRTWVEEDTRARSVFLARRDGVGPLHDLVLARFRT